GELLVLMPKEVLEQLEQNRQLHADLFEDSYLRWHDQPIGHSDVNQCVDLAHTYEGDSIIVCPQHPRTEFELPRHSDKVRVIQGGFQQPKLLCHGGKFETEFEYFEASHAGRKSDGHSYETRTAPEELAALFRAHFTSGRTH